MSSSHDDEPHEEHEEHVNHEAWVIPYADLLTLLMAMFIALFAMSNVDKDKFKAVAVSLNKALSGEDLNTGVFAQPNGQGLAPGQGDGGNSGSANSAGKVGPSTASNEASIIQKLLDQSSAQNATRDQERALLKSVEEQLKKKTLEIGAGNNLQLELQERGLVVRIVTDKVLFASASNRLTPDGVELIGTIGAIVGKLDQQIIVEGHTDDQSISNEFFASNWSLSSARASSVVEELIAHGLNPDRLRATGYGDRKPLVPNDSDVNRAKNRRVEIVVQSQMVNGADNRAPVTEPDLKNAKPDTQPGIDDIVGDLSNL